nr:MAG TPA: hypothetical protein [Caudoviricetes sp.]
MKSYKHKIYTTLGTPTSADTELVPFKDYVGDSTGVPVKDYTIRGKSIVWNQLIQNGNFQDDSNWYREGGDYIVDSNLLTFTADGSTSSPFIAQNINKSNFIEEHYYYACTIVNPSNYSDVEITFALHNGSNFQQAIASVIATSGSKYLFEEVFTLESDFTKDLTDSARIMVYAPQSNASPGYITFISNIMLIDLTKMFGSGYEPQTPAQFRAMFPEDYYEYDEGTLKSVEPTQLQSSSVERYQMADFGTLYGSGGDLDFTANFSSDTKIIKGHIYLLHGDIAGNSGKCTLYYGGNNTGEIFIVVDKNNSYAIGTSKYTVQGGKLNTLGYFWIYGYQCESATNIMFIDLTELFGAGNEPQTVEDFQSYFPDSYYKSNPSAYKFVNIPSSKYFPDGMRSAGSAYDEINFLSQKAIKRIGVRVYQAGDESDADVTTDLKNTNYALATPAETVITPPLQALPTYKEFNSFSAPNTLTQTGPFSITYYSTLGSNPEKGWLTSYKRKLYMGRNIEWNQLLDKSNFRSTEIHSGVTIKNNGDGTYTLNGTYNLSGTDWFSFYDDSNLSIAKRLYGHKVLYGLISNVNSELINTPFGMTYEINDTSSNGIYLEYNVSGSAKIETLNKVALADITQSVFYIVLRKPSSGVAVYKNVIIKPQLFDLTQMFGAGNEPSTPEEFWSYFDHKLYPYNTGETQPLFKISRKSQYGSNPKHYAARWNKIDAQMERLYDASSIPTDITNFVHRGSVNANYSNPFDGIYPWSGIKLCNISIDLYRNLAAGDSITKCVTAWEGDANFSYNDTNGVWRYRPEFWGKSWENDTYRYFDVADKNVYDSSYVHYPEAVVGRWHGRTVTMTIGGEEKTCLIPSVGMPVKNIIMSNLHTYAKNYGATLDSIYSVDADTLLCVVEFATMNTQNAIGNGVSNLSKQSSDFIQENVTNSTTVKVLATAGSTYCIPGAIFDIGTSFAGAQVGSFTVVSATPNVGDAKYLDVTLDQAVTATTTNYWSVHGLVNVADEAIGSKSGYIGTNGKCNAYYRGIVMYGNMWFYILGAYENKDDHHIWIANNDAEADNYDDLDMTVHYDTGLVLPAAKGFIKKLGLLSRPGLLSIPAFCVEIGGDSTNPVGDYCYNDIYTSNTVLQRGGFAGGGDSDGAFYGTWDYTALNTDWGVQARPRLKNP